jgi:hypothetical protein
MQDDKNEETYSDTINHSYYVFEKEIATVAVTKVGVLIEPGGYAKYVTEDSAEIDVLKKCLLKLEENNAGAVRSENEPEREYKVEVFYADGTKEIRRYTLFLLSRYPNAMESFFALFPKRHIDPVIPISNLNFHVAGDVDEKKIDVRLEKYRDLSDCVIVGVHLSDGERQKTVRAFFEKYPELQRRVTQEENRALIHYMQVRRLSGFWQESDAATDEMIPDWDLTGVFSAVHAPEKERV